MIKLIYFEDSNWDIYINDIYNADIYYLREYVSAFRLIGDGDPYLVYYEGNGIRAINVVMLRDISKVRILSDHLPAKTWYDISTPYGYGGFIINGNITAESLNSLNDEYTHICNENNIICEFSRFHPVLNNVHLLEEIYDVKKLNNTITIDLKSDDYIWENFTSKNRNMIRKAIKNNIIISNGNNEFLMNTFFSMYNETMKRDNANKYYFFPKEFYTDLATHLKNKMTLFYAKKDSQLIAIAIILYYNKQMHYHLSASEFNFRSYAATNLLLYEAAKWGLGKGLNTFHLGGGVSAKEDGLLKFKKAFNKNSNTSFAIGRKIFNRDKYSEFVNIVKDKKVIEDKNYFPEYRA